MSASELATVSRGNSAGPSKLLPPTTSRVKPFCTACPDASLTETVKLKVPAAPGMPAKSPLLGSRVIPGGTLPEALQL